MTGVTLVFTLFIAPLVLPIKVLMAQEEKVQVLDGVAQDAVPKTEGATQEADQAETKRYQFMQTLRDQLRASQNDFYSVTKNVGDAKGHLEEIELETSTLRDQLNNLDQHLATTKELIMNVAIQITEKENSIVKLYEEIELKKMAIENQKSMLLDYLNALYEQQNAMNDTLSGEHDINVAKMLLSDMPIGEQLQEMKYFNILEDAGHELFDRLEVLVVALEEDQQQQEEQKTILAQLRDRLEEEKNTFDIQRLAKAQLLKQTNGEEAIYQQLLEQSKKQQEELRDDLKVLRSNLDFIQQKMDELGDKFNPDDYKGILGEGMGSVLNYIKSTKDAGDFKPIWPVSPSSGITAYFHDAGYRSVFHMEHNAIDIRAAQSTPVRAPADGVVYKAKDNGYGYSYLILAHQGGFMTVYGHVSEFRVEQGDTVFAGQVVALSGATPGTKGAGLMTTGPHLHFEVMKGGKYVDPLDYLPLSSLDIDALPEKYRSRVIGENKVKRVADEDTANTEATETVMSDSL